MTQAAQDSSALRRPVFLSWWFSLRLFSGQRVWPVSKIESFGRNGRPPMALQRPVSGVQSSGLRSYSQVPDAGLRSFENHPCSAAVRHPQDSRDAVVGLQLRYSCRKFGHPLDNAVWSKYVNCTEAARRPVHAAEADIPVALSRRTNPPLWVHCNTHQSVPAHHDKPSSLQHSLA